MEAHASVAKTAIPSCSWRRLFCMGSDQIERFGHGSKALFIGLFLPPQEWDSHNADDHDYIGTEHLLLGLLADHANVGTHVLHSFGITADRVRKALDYINRQMEQKGSPSIEEHPVGLTPRALAAMTLAASEAARIHQALITPELLLIGIIREGEGIGAGILRTLGADLEKVRAQIYAFLMSAGKASEAPAPKANVITCRIGDQEMDAIDALVEAGVRSSRSEAAAWLIQAGIGANQALLETVYGTVAEIRRLRVVAQSMARDASAPST